jgi:thiamine pyrophosphate-dependent acetolactate synthase large subunit-like protein
MSKTLNHGSVISKLESLREDNDVVIATMTAGMLYPEYSKHDMDLVSMAPMGMASAFGHGVALGRPDLGVIVVDSDGSILMNLGTLVTIGGSQPKKFLHIIMENGGYDITGGQSLPGTGTEHVPEFANSVGYVSATRVSDPADLDSVLEQAMADMHGGVGPVLLTFVVPKEFDWAELPRQTHSEKAVLSLGQPGYENLRDQIAARAVV